MAEHIRMPRTDLADEWQQDLHPREAADGRNAATAYDYKDVHRRLHDLDDGVLKEIPIIPAGSYLEQGAVYLDLADPEHQEFRASGNEVADDGRVLVAKNDVDYVVWNVLTGVENAERLDRANET